MIKSNDGGPVIPAQIVKDGDGLFREVTDYGFTGGMTLRDYFAAKELARMEHANCMVNDVQGAYDRVAKHCYRMADAMLMARAA